MWYNLIGIANTILIIGCLVGLMDQIRRIRRRWKIQPPPPRGYATEALSVNGFFSSFIAFYSFFLFSIMMDPIDLYLFFSRLFALTAVMTILFSLFRDREPLSQRLPFVCAVALMLTTLLLIPWRDDLRQGGQWASSALVVAATFVVFQGGLGQIRALRKVAARGALSLPSQFLFLSKDLSNALFGVVIGPATGWPLIFMGFVCASLRAAIIWTYLGLEKTSAHP